MNIGKIQSRLKKIFDVTHNGCAYPAPMFFTGAESDIDQQIAARQEIYKRQGYSPKAIAQTPIFIENELANSFAC
jgi:hypothetical protein